MGPSIRTRVKAIFDRGPCRPAHSVVLRLCASRLDRGPTQHSPHACSPQPNVGWDVLSLKELPISLLLRGAARTGGDDARHGVIQNVRNVRNVRPLPSIAQEAPAAISVPYHICTGRNIGNGSLARVPAA